MILVTRTRVDGTPLVWIDTATRVLHNEMSGIDMPRPLTDAEDDALDALTLETGQASAEAALRQQLANGVTDIVAAREAAEQDVVVAQGLRATALDVQSSAIAQRDAVLAFAPAATYQQTQLAAVKSQLAQILARQDLIAQALAGIYGYRIAVDENAVVTDNALLWLAQLMSGILDDQNGGN